MKVGVIGCGLMGTLHARTLAALPGVRVVAVQNRTRAKAEVLANEVGATVYDSYTDLLEQDLDAVWVATPDHLHVEIAEAVLAAGKHLFLEKALATSVADGRKIVAAGKKHPHLKAMVGYPLRFDPCYRKMREILSRSEAGQVAQAWSIRAHFLDPEQRVYDKYRDEHYSPPGWYFSPDEGKGPVFSHASHDYDLFNWLCGDIERVFVYGGTYVLPPGSVADGFTVALRFKNGGVGSVSTPWITRVEYDFVGVATNRLTVVNNNNEICVKGEKGPEERITFKENDMWVAMNSHFIECIREDKAPLISLADGLKAIAVSEAAHRSLQEGREVEVQSVDG